MGAQVAQVFLISCSFASESTTTSDESHESDEGSEGWQGHDSNSRVRVRCRNHWLEDEGREGSHGGPGGRSSRSAEKGWLFQDRRCAELEVEAETCNTCAQGCQPFHERALCFQSQASIKDRKKKKKKKKKKVRGLETT